MKRTISNHLIKETLKILLNIKLAKIKGNLTKFKLTISLKEFNKKL